MGQPLPTAQSAFSRGKGIFTAGEVAAIYHSPILVQNERLAVSPGLPHGALSALRVRGGEPNQSAHLPQSAPAALGEGEGGQALAQALRGGRQQAAQGLQQAQAQLRRVQRLPARLAAAHRQQLVVHPPQRCLLASACLHLRGT